MTGISVTGISVYQIDKTNFRLNIARIIEAIELILLWVGSGKNPPQRPGIGKQKIASGR
jgi:hypothetical protein